MGVSTLASVRTAASNRLHQRLWDRRADSWDEHGAPGLEAVIETVLGLTDAHDGTIAVDLGSGTGQLSLPLAHRGASVTAVDLSPQMISRLMAKARQGGVDRIAGVVSPIQALELTPESCDLVVSNYTLHHLRDAEKQAVVKMAYQWLRPGGRLVVGDMMFGRGLSQRDRSIIAAKVAVFVRRGPAGWWRIVKGVVRFSLRLGERPVSVTRWREYFEAAGFSDISVVPVVAEAAVIVGIKR
jgi:2-polyprenyl-3-methyl-5-hydroxy-6-metoxy-1,4-benzoquinol methylase